MNQVDADKNLAISLSNQCAYLDFDPTIYSYSEMIDIISKYHFFLGTRFHSCIFSMLSATPFVSINYLPKSRGILNQLKLSELSVDINQCDRDLFPAVKKVLSNLTNTSNLIQESLLTYESDFIAPFVIHLTNTSYDYFHRPYSPPEGGFSIISAVYSQLTRSEKQVFDKQIHRYNILVFFPISFLYYVFYIHVFHIEKSKFILPFLAASELSLICFSYFSAVHLLILFSYTIIVLHICIERVFCFPLFILSFPKLLI